MFDVVPFNAFQVLPGDPFADHLIPCVALLHFVKGQLQINSTPGGDGGSDLIVAVEAAKAINTFGSILCLAANGFGPQAAMLSRPIYESALVASWTTHNRELATRLYDLNERYLMRLHFLNRQQAGIFDDSGEPSCLTDEEKKEARKHFGPYGEKSWTCFTIPDLHIEFNKHTEDAQARRDQDAYFNSINKFVNWTIHSSGLGLWILSSPGDPALGQDSEDCRIILGPSALMVRDALSWGEYTLGLMLRVYELHFGEVFGPDLDRHFEDVRASFLNSDTRGDLGRKKRRTN